MKPITNEERVIIATQITLDLLKIDAETSEVEEALRSPEGQEMLKARILGDLKLLRAA